MSAKRCRYGKLKHKVGARRCKKRPTRGRRGARRGKRRSGGRSFKIAGIGVLGLAAIGAAAYFVVPQLTA